MELINHATGILSQAARPIMQGIKKKNSSPVGFIKRRSRFTPHLPCSMLAVNKISELITGNSILSKLNEIFTLMVNFVVSLPMLCSCGPVCKNLDFKSFPVDAAIAGSKLWSLYLFQ